MSRVAIVTGGTRGIGRAICERLRDERGFTIIANYAGNDDAARRFTEEPALPRRASMSAITTRWSAPARRSRPNMVRSTWW